MIHTNPVTGTQFHVGGRKRSDPNRKKRFFSKYRSSDFVVPDVEDCDYTLDSTGALLVCLSDALGNTKYGNCTSAGPCHLVEAVTHAAGSPVVLSEDDALGFYSQSTGYVRGDPATDQGGDIPSVLESWRTKGIGGKHQIAGWFDVSLEEDPKTLRWLIKTFGGLIAGTELPDAWLNIGGKGFRWDAAAPNPNNGHCYPLLGARGTDYVTISWGLRGLVSHAATASLDSQASGGELFAIVTKEAQNAVSGMGLTGLNWDCAVSEFDSEGGTVTA